ncbi:MAG: UbiD family decarboxylase [Burkholderiales bacterium]|nr:UbiD family decarboxylase [Burkholderiales bacterium]
MRRFLAEEIAAHAGEVLRIDEELESGEDLTALVFALAARGKHPVIDANAVRGAGCRVVTNLFGSRERIARMLGCTPATIHATYQARSRALCAPRVLPSGPITDVVESADVDLARLPMLRHFETDRAAYITNGVIAADHPDTGLGNLSYHRSMRHSSTELATSLHSRGHLWRILEAATAKGRELPVAMVIGAHPLFMLAAAGRLPLGVDERHVAGGLMGAPLEVVKTPRHGIAVPAYAEFVLEGVIVPGVKVDEGPFGEFTGYSSNRSTNNLFRVETMMRRRDAILVDVVGGNSAEHLNLGRVPRESEMVEKLKERFPAVTAVHYPSSGTHFHAYVAVKQMRDGEARQIMLGLLGWDPYLKTVVAVDEDVDITRDEEVLWALATHFQPHRDIVLIDGLPGSALDPSAGSTGTTSRMGLDATRGAAFDGVRARVSAPATARAGALLKSRGLA